MSEAQSFANSIQTDSVERSRQLPLPGAAPTPLPSAKIIHTIRYLSADLVVVLVAASIAMFSPLALEVPAKDSIAKHFCFVALYAGLLTLSRLYVTGETYGTGGDQRVPLRAVALVTFVVAAFIYVSGTQVISRLIVGETILFSTLALIGWRFLRQKVANEALGVHNVLIVGAGPIGRGLEAFMSENPQLGFVVKGYLDRRQNGFHSRVPERRQAKNGINILGNIGEFTRVARSHFIDEILITASEDRAVVKHLICEARRCGINVKVVPDFYDGLAATATVEYLRHIPLMSLCHRSVPHGELIAKQCIDAIASLLALIVFFPALLVIALLIKLSSPGPILYRSTRIGKKGREFTCYKFRTMVANADELQDSLHHLNEREEILFKIANDPRITPLGRVLRKYSIDELPQLVNVLKGDMSLVGPRPPVPSEYEKYNLDHLRRLDVLPGITGLWQVAARQDRSFRSYIALDTQYVNNWNLWLDCKILVRTIGAVLAGTGQ